MSLRFLGQDIGRRLKNINAGVSELADETDSKSVIRKGVWVRVPSRVRIKPCSERVARLFLCKKNTREILGSPGCRFGENAGMRFIRRQKAPRRSPLRRPLPGRKDWLVRFLPYSRIRNSRSSVLRNRTRNLQWCCSSR